MTDERFWIEVEYRLKGEPGYVRPPSSNHFRQLQNGIMLQKLFPNKEYQIRVRCGKGGQVSDWFYPPIMTTTKDGELLVTFEIR